jgi:phosphotriesterase-related protein
MIVRLDPRYEDGPQTVELIAAAGLEPSRIVLSNIDGYVSDPTMLRRLAASGATLKWSFGYEAPPRPGLRSATDAQRADALVELFSQGFKRQVLACGVWTRSALSHNGGFGYRHLLAAAVPALRDRGLREADLRGLLVEQPAWLLNQPAPLVRAG